MATLVCVARSGGRYDGAWVERLARGARRYVRGLERIVCLTDLRLDIRGVETVPLRHDWPYWWAKMEAFRPDLGADRRVLLDLDSLLIDDASALLCGEGTVAMEDFFHSGRLSSAVVAFNGADLGHVYHRFARDPERWMRPGSCGEVPNAVHGDQVVIDHFLRDAGEPVTFWQDRADNPLEFHNPDRPPRGPLVVFIGESKPDTACARTRALWRGEREALAA